MNLKDRNREKKYFKVNVKQYAEGKDFSIYRPASLKHPRDNAVMFILEAYMNKVSLFHEVKECLIFWPEQHPVPEELDSTHCIVRTDNPHLAYCQFYKDNKITYLPSQEGGTMVNGAWIAKNARIDNNVVIMPGAYISGEAHIGAGSYIGCGTKILGDVCIGRTVVIRENSVIGADGLSTDRDMDGHAVTMPQFGGIVIDDSVQIGANTVVARGAIDDTYIGKRSKIDNSCFISHNVTIDEDAFVVGESIMFGSSSLGKQAYVSGNATIRNGIHVGEKALVGMGAVVIRNVSDREVVKGNPAK